MVGYRQSTGGGGSTFWRGRACAEYKLTGKMCRRGSSGGGEATAGGVGRGWERGGGIRHEGGQGRRLSLFAPPKGGEGKQEKPIRLGSHGEAKGRGSGIEMLNKQ